MNLSGESVQAVYHFYDIELDNIVVIHDDLDLAFGAIRVKKGGGHGGHNGLRSIDKHITPEYKRLRCGIGKPLSKEEVAHYVLSNYTTAEMKILDDELLDVYGKCSLALLQAPIEHVASTMTRK
jgi:PTH1 family peptidyl-tRNA hydrolase